MTQMTKDDATEKKKFVAALRAEQELEEHMGFAPNPILHRTQGMFLFFFVGYCLMGSCQMKETMNMKKKTHL